tara:strand:+ start:1696 stop:2259 length:564 start_codon:yes stop_codon:yes gene_type:complete
MAIQFRLNNFISKIRREDLSRASRFEAIIQAPAGVSIRGSRTVSLLCEEAMIPGLQTTYAPIKLGNWLEPRVAGVEYFIDNATLTFYLDTEQDVRTYLEEWMLKTQADPISKEIGFYNNYVGEVIVHALDRKDRITGSWKLVDAFPRIINLTPLAMGNDTPNRVSVIFSYKYWERYEGRRLASFFNR